MFCGLWKLRPKWKFDMKIQAQNTSHPILWLTNTRDPVTPIANARRMAKRFPGSVLFGQDADGHCTIAQPSRCVAKGIREYFQTGHLPKGEIACAPDRGIFDKTPDDLDKFSSEDLQLMVSSQSLSELFRWEDSRPGF